MTKSKAIPWWGWLAWVLAMVLGALAYHHLPAEVPTHFNFAGQPDRFRPRLIAILIQPAAMLFIILLWHVLWRIDPKKKNYQDFWPTYRYIGGVIVVFLGFIYLWSLGRALNILGISSIKLIPTMIGILIFLFSNVLPRLQPNWRVGIRTAWTLSSEKSWIRTHRLAGNLGIPTGLLIIILAWILPDSMGNWAVLGPTILWLIITIVASYFYAK
ncbi:MAG: SdpI family protein [Thermoactinomyces sp.]|jgi:uncharacterized membrane protein